jgi:hypothetical protein
MKKLTLTPLCLAIGMAFVAPASMAVTIDFSGSNIYMKFLDGDRHVVSQDSGDTASGTDNGQWTEMELRIKATISPQVEAGVRIQSRSPAAYWTNFGFANNEGFTGAAPGDIKTTQSKFMKLRGAYVQLTPGYSWLNTAVIGANDWGSFDAFTVGKIRYIDRDNYNGFYFKGPVAGGGSWEAARVSLPNYLQANYGQGSACCNSDDTQFNEAVYIAQFKKNIAGAKLAASYQVFNDNQKVTTDTNILNGQDVTTFSKNNVLMLKGEGSPVNGVDVRAALYHSEFTGPLFDQSWINSPKSSISDNAYKLDVDFSALPVAGLTVNAQYFNIGAGYYSNAAARRESDVLLTEGSEAAWYNWGQSLWMGGAAKDYQQGAASPKNMWRNQPGANGLTDNAYIDFDEAPAESSIGWKGLTVVTNYEAASTPMSLELTNIGYNNNWQGYSATGPLSHFFAANQDRKTNLVVFKASHVFPIAGGLDTGFKWKHVASTDKVNAAIASDDLDVTDNGYVFSVGNQLHNDLYTGASWGKYTRDEKVGGTAFNTDKTILSLKASYNLTGLEIGALAQWIKGSGFPDIANPRADFEQYRMKAYLKAIF